MRRAMGHNSIHSAEHIVNYRCGWSYHPPHTEGGDAKPMSQKDYFCNVTSLVYPHSLQKIAAMNLLLVLDTKPFVLVRNVVHVVEVLLHHIVSLEHDSQVKTRLLCCVEVIRVESADWKQQKTNGASPLGVTGIRQCCSGRYTLFFWWSL